MPTEDGLQDVHLARRVGTPRNPRTPGRTLP